MKSETSRRQRSTWSRSLPSCATPSTIVCHVSCSSTSATETLNFACTRDLIERSTARLPLSEWFSGRYSVSRRIPTTTACPAEVGAQALAVASGFGAAFVDFLLLGREQAFERRRHFVDQLIDDGVRAKVDAFALGKLPRLSFRTDVEADDDRVGCHRELHVGFVDRTDAAVDDPERH